MCISFPKSIAVLKRLFFNNPRYAVADADPEQEGFKEALARAERFKWRWAKPKSLHPLPSELLAGAEIQARQMKVSSDFFVFFCAP